MGDEIEKRGMRARIREYLDSHYKSVTAKKVLRIIDAFPSIEKFCKSTPGEWLLVYRGVRPKSSFDIGKTCKKALSEVIAFIRDQERNDMLDKLAKERAEQEAREAKEKAQREAEEEETRQNPKFSLGEIKSLVAMMELCDIKAIDLRKIKQILSAMDVNIKEKQD